jgi:hypothetical protein
LRALGVSNTLVHSAARSLSSFFAGEALAIGAAAKNAIAVTNTIRVIRDTTNPLVDVTNRCQRGPPARDFDLIDPSTDAAILQLLARVNSEAGTTNYRCSLR